MRLEKAVSTLERVTGFPPIKMGGNSYKAVCPCHDDANPSLSIKRADKGPFTLFYCHAGCNWEKIIATLVGGKTKYRWSKDKYLKWLKEQKEGRELVKVYTYRDEYGRHVMRKLRYEPKSFALRYYVKGQWLPDRPANFTPVLYNLPQVIKSNVVFILEGEKAVDKINEWGLVGTCTFTGASGGNTCKWDAELYNKYLRDKHIIILPDNDRPGRQHAKGVYDTLTGVKSKKVLKLPGLAPKADFYDWAQVNSIKDLRTLWASI